MKDELRDALAKAIRVSASTYPTKGYPARDAAAICTTLGITREMVACVIEGADDPDCDCDRCKLIRALTALLDLAEES